MDLPLTVGQLVQHGTIVRKTGSIVGLAVYTGGDTKLNQNKSAPPSKTSVVDDTINRYVIFIFLAQLVFVFCFASIGSIYSGLDANRWYLGMQSDSVVHHGDHKDVIGHIDVDDPEWAQTGLNHSSTLQRTGPGLRGYGEKSAIVSTLPWYSPLVLPLRFLLLSSMMVPISLKVTLDTIKVWYATLIGMDEQLHTPGLGYANASNSAICEDLGAIDCILTDKTGTLTENVMKLAAMYVDGEELFTEPLTTELRTRIVGRPRLVDFLKVMALCNTVDPEHVDARPLSDRLPTGIADSVIPIDVAVARERCVEYASSSPDEEALVHGAAILGVGLALRRSVADGGEIVTLVSEPRLLGMPAMHQALSLRDADMLHKRIWIRDDGIESTYTVLHILEFTSARKCMSVLLRRVDTGRAREEFPDVLPKRGTELGQGFGGIDTDELVLLTKGADDVVFPKLVGHDAASLLACRQKVERYASQGLRTLVFGARGVSSREYAKWLPVWEQAHREIHDRETHIARACEQIEHSLDLLGCTAIEDKLQDQVPAAISQLRAAGIKFWMLTGDKSSTALQIAAACQMLQPAHAGNLSASGIDQQARFFINGSTVTMVQEQLLAAKKKLGNGLDPQVKVVREAFEEEAPLVQGENGLSSSTVLVLDGMESIRLALGPQNIKLLEEVSMKCKIVICCRCLPAQKASLVELVKGSGQRCLAIGDGGNDVAMIQAAHVGVGLAGREGKQAARAADFVISRFRFISRLVLIHGRLSTYRTSLIAKYTFYKSMCVCFLQLAYNCSCSFSGCSLLDTFALTTYNLLFTFLPGLSMAVDKDRELNEILEDPPSYASSQSGKWLAGMAFLSWCCRAVYQSIVLLVVAMLGMSSAGGVMGVGVDQMTLSYAVFTGLVVIQMITVLTETRRPTIVTLIASGGCLLLYVLLVLSLSYFPRSSPALGFARSFFNNGQGVFTVTFMVICALGPWLLTSRMCKPVWGHSGLVGLFLPFRARSRSSSVDKGSHLPDDSVPSANLVTPGARSVVYRSNATKDHA